MSAEHLTEKRGFSTPAWLAWTIYWGLCAALLLFGLILTAGGGLLASKGGSIYYLAAGLLQLAAGVQMVRRRRSAIHIYVFYFAITWIWALFEVGLDGWSLLPRTDMACLLFPFVLLPFINARMVSDRLSDRLRGAQRLYFPFGLTWVVLIAALIGARALRTDHGPVTTPEPPARAEAAMTPLDAEWRHLGQNLAGQRYSPIALINRDNVKNLRLEWDYVGPEFQPDPVDPNAPKEAAGIHAGRRDEQTPLYANGKLYFCDTENIVTALDAEDGKVVWRKDPKIDRTGVPSRVCRGVAYYEDAASKICPKRIINATLDMRLIAYDAETGERCADFGTNGEVSVRTGFGKHKIGQVYPTSPVTIVNGVAVMGAMVTDNYSTGEPSGVIRGFDAHTGKFLWAWDMGRPGQTGEPKEGESYTPGTPNAWTFFSGDEALGLVYVPTGNGTPDYLTSHRKPEWAPYSSAVVAIEVATGKVRWVFQTTHEDVWDYDLGSQPVLYDWPMPKGTVPTLIQTTKSGQLFVLDRRTGVPVFKVVEKPVPQTDIPGEKTAPTQPFSVEMPNLGGPDMVEKDAWGISIFDQLFCRLQFHQLRYEGMYTPPSTRGSIQYPGQTGGSDWGGITIDRGRNLLIAPSSRIPSKVVLYKRFPGMGPIKHTEPQLGTDYLVNANIWVTPLYVPCKAPPYGMLSAYDLNTRKLVWERPVGTAEELGPRGIKSHLPFVVGSAPMVGGVIATGGDLIFMGVTSDRKLRAVDTVTGRVLWSTRLPEGSQATPLTYRSPRSGRQMVAIVSGSTVDILGQNNKRLHVVAYALPK